MRIASEHLKLTDRRAERLRLQGYRQRDVGLVMGCGAPAGTAVLVAVDGNVERWVAGYGHRIAGLERLHATAVILADPRGVPGVVGAPVRPAGARSMDYAGRSRKSSIATL